MAAFFGTMGIFIVPESSHSRLLQIRAQKIRFETKNWAIHAKADETPLDVYSVIHTYLFRPFAMLVQEPVLLLLTIYLSYIYGIMYLFFEAYPISFQEERGWNQGVGALPFIGILIGILLGSITITYTVKPLYKNTLNKNT
jgi:MFS transporter, DHA1 family, multidrug resistance protein